MSLIVIPELIIPNYDPKDENYSLTVAINLLSWTASVVGAIQELQGFVVDGQGLTLTMFSASDYIAGNTGIIDRTGAVLLFDGDPTGGGGAAGWWRYNGTTWDHL